MPLLGTLAEINLADNSTYAQNRSLASESATVGLFTTTLTNGINIEITSSNHSAFIRYTFPSGSTITNASTYGMAATNEITSLSASPSDAHILVDLAHVLPGYSTQAYSQKFLHGNLHLRPGESEASPSYYGTANYYGGWSEPESHTVHFCGNFSVPSSSSLVPSNTYVSQDTREAIAGAGTFSWVYDPVQPPAFSSRPNATSFNDIVTYSGSGMGIGALFSWSPSGNNASADSVLEAKLGISYINADKACAHVADELPASMSFEDVVQQARDEWETKVLSSIEVVDDGSEGSSNTTLMRMLYSALYQTALMPTDKTGENPRWISNSSSPYYDDYYVSDARVRLLEPPSLIVVLLDTLGYLPYLNAIVPSALHQYIQSDDYRSDLYFQQ